ncbi:MAG: ATP-binding protein [Candidatus Magasanikbacteria bacterium]|nr:ATP-binding protein [Candidatus Magasanikbacteria bacterium]
MTKEAIFKILLDWNFWQKDIETGMPRKFYIDKLTSFLKSGQVITITGARRSGKSFIMRQLAKSLVAGGVLANDVFIINFEDPRFPKLDTEFLDRIYETYLEFVKPKGRPFVFLDEVQEVANWEKWAGSFHELRKGNLVISGSNAKLLSKELGTLLTGRHLDLMVLPLSFKEFLQFRGLSVKDDMEMLSNEIAIRGYLRDYMEYGGFPEAVLRENKKEILLTYFDDLIEKDLIRRHKIRKGEKLKELLRFYFSNISSPITFGSAEKFLGISADTIQKFSQAMEDAYLLFFNKRFSFKIKEQDQSPRKIYAIDPGLANIIGFKFSENIGKLAENAVYLKLLHSAFSNPDIEIYYWKDDQHREIDFIVKEKTDVKQLIQVAWDIQQPKTKEREIKSLLKGMEALKKKEGIIINSEIEGEERVNGKIIRFVPIWKWL